MRAKGGTHSLRYGASGQRLLIHAYQVCYAREISINSCKLHQVPVLNVLCLNFEKGGNLKAKVEQATYVSGR